jgi:ParB-like chromosome segregation protein Spo0J
MNKVMNIGALVLDEKLQSRIEIDEAAVSDYSENIKAGDEFPPVLVYFDGINYYLTDGYHRYHAHKRADKVSILCSVVNGTFRDAVLHATGVNAKHGMRRTHADKRKAVMTLLDDFEWSDWSNAEIARQCGVSPTFVANLRDSGGPAEVKYKTAGGNIATKAKAPGRAAKEPAPKEPELKEKASEPKVEDYDARDELIAHLTKENDELTMNLALAHLGGTEAEQAEAREVMNAVREELRVLKIELAAVKQSRDAFQSENQQLKAQCASYQRQLKKLQP